MSNENNSLKKDELITKLEAISILYSKALSIKNKMNNFVPEDNYERKIIVPAFPGEYENAEQREEWEDIIDHTDSNAIEQISHEYDSHFCPREPRKPNEGKRPTNEEKLTKEYKQKKGWQPLVASFVAVCSLISGGLFSGDTLTIVLNAAIIIFCIFIVLKFYKKRKELNTADEEATKLAIKNYEEKIKEQEQKYAQDMEEYHSLMNSYKLLRADFIKEYTQWREIYIKSLDEEAKINANLEEDRIDAVNKIDDEEYTPVLNDLAILNDLISTEYLPSIDTIIDLLKSNRADTLKEALNLYEELVYRERQFQFEREKEAHRQFEAAQKHEAEERYRKEQLNLQKEQEYNRQEEARKQLEITERHHQEEMKQREQEDRNRQKEFQASRQKRCDWCAHKSTCRQRYYAGAYNCTGFTPKS